MANNPVNAVDPDGGYTNMYGSAHSGGAGSNTVAFKNPSQAKFFFGSIGSTAANTSGEEKMSDIYDVLYGDGSPGSGSGGGGGEIGGGTGGVNRGFGGDPFSGGIEFEQLDKADGKEDGKITDKYGNEQTAADFEASIAPSYYEHVSDKVKNNYNQMMDGPTYDVYYTENFGFGESRLISSHKSLAIASAKMQNVFDNIHSGSGYDGSSILLPEMQISGSFNASGGITFNSLDGGIALYNNVQGRLDIMTGMDNLQMQINNMQPVTGVAPIPNFSKFNPKDIYKAAKLLRNLARRGQAPSSIKRVDIPKLGQNGKPIFGQKPHVHLKDGRAFNLDGSWKHGEGDISNEIWNWLDEFFK